ncbi:hypothetical protein ACS0TY_030477 [Phlomoides rotata]
MVTLRSKAPENLNNIAGEEEQQAPLENEDGHENTISEYELSREERIRENRLRMEKLGIFDLSQKFNAHKPKPKRGCPRKTPKCDSPLPPSGPVRRSGRLQNSTPVSYCEVNVAKKDKSLNDYDILREEGSKPEVYTEEHEKLLGSTEMIWTPFVDGYGKDGKRIYDSIKGKTCHQCRQKTLGHRTRCSKCDMVQGQFCGDCLYMRYGENVLEAKANPDWICPVCRGICNCSLCRQAKGWPPTGALYRKISSLGYKSVAHYLIQTRNANVNVPTSAKRSLPFKDIDVTVGEDDLYKPISESLNADPLSLSDKESEGSKLAPESAAEPLLNCAVATLSKDQVEHLLKPEELGAECNSELKKEQKIVTEQKSNTELLYDLSINESNKGSLSETLEIKNLVAIEKTPKSTKKRARFEPPSPDSVAGRLRLRRSKANAGETSTIDSIAVN